MRVVPVLVIVRLYDSPTGAGQAAVSMNTTVCHTKMNKAVTKQAVTEDAVTQYGGNQGQRISILTILGH